MAYTQPDLDSVEAAIVALATGQRAATVTIDGMSVQYALAGMDKLRGLRVEMERGLRSSASLPAIVLSDQDFQGVVGGTVTVNAVDLSNAIPPSRGAMGGVLHEVTNPYTPQETPLKGGIYNIRALNQQH